MINSFVASAGVLIAGVGVHIWGAPGWAMMAAGVFMIFVSFPGDDD